MAWFSPQQLLLPQMIENNRRWLGHKPALIVDDEVKSWQQFAGDTARVANALTASGVKPGDRVAILMDNSGEMVLAQFGVIRAGAVAVPLNISISDDAVASMLNDSQAKAIVASPAHVERVNALKHKLPEQLGERYIACGGSFPGWIEFDAWIADASPEPPAIEIAAEDECNIIYSSGTTGLPKGIVHDHRCRAAWAYDMAVGLRYHSGARTLCALGLFSNITWVAMLSTILAGGAIVVMRKFTAAGFLDLIETQAITHTVVVPVQLQRMLELPQVDATDFSGLHSVMCCGSPLPADDKRRLCNLMGSAFMELYGLTEGLVTILSPEDLPKRPESVGLPCPGQQLKILDNDDRECAIGESGEIIGRGPLMMSGYNNRDAENEAATWVDPQGNKWLRTGDIGRLDSEGFLYLVDRKKDMIISGGQNIYPADIESVALTHDKVQEVAVIGVNSKRWGETPMAVVVLREPVDTRDLHAWINERVGKQQRIAGIEIIDELPRNPNGKVLKRVLRENYADVWL